MTKCLVDGKEIKPDDDHGNITLKNIQSDHTITLIYERVWLQRIVLAGITLAAISVILLLLHMRRMRKRRQRARELRKIRLENRYFFQTMDDLEELENRLSEHPEEIAGSEEELEQLLDELKPNEKEEK